MIILVQSCLLRHGFISAVCVSLNDCQYVAAACMKRGYSSLHPLMLSPLFLLSSFNHQSIYLFPTFPPQSLSSSFIFFLTLPLFCKPPPLTNVLTFSSFHLAPVSLQTSITFPCSFFLLSHPCSFPFHHSPLICSFSKTLITQGVSAWLHPLRFPGLFSFLSSPPPTFLTLFLNLYHFPSSILLSSCNGLRLCCYYKVLH